MKMHMVQSRDNMSFWCLLLTISLVIYIIRPIIQKSDQIGRTYTLNMLYLTLQALDDRRFYESLKLETEWSTHMVNCSKFCQVSALHNVCGRYLVTHPYLIGVLLGGDQEHAP